MKITKRDGRVVEFDSSKIEQAILNAMQECGTVSTSDKVLAKSIAESFNGKSNLTVESIQDSVERKLMASSRKDVAKAYIIYRKKRTEQRELDTTVKARDLFNQSDSYLMKENANKRPELTNVQFSYLGGILSTHYNRTQVFSSEVLRAHDKGAIHIHDLDMSALPGITNCSLENLYDCLVNGTVLNGVKIAPQTKFVTACTVATQIIQGVAGCQYGGITVSMSHLVPALKSNHEYLKRKASELGLYPSAAEAYVSKQLARIVKDGVQTFMYQVNSMFTTQGQTPFLTVNLQMSEVSDEDKFYLAMIIEEVLKQRIEGFQDRYGNWVAPAFPKLIFVLSEETMYGKYKYLRELAAKCNTSRMVPDYISEKVMKKIHGHVFPSMGCLAYDTPVTMADGTMKSVQDIVPGDFVMGGDGSPRMVTDLVRGYSKMYKINQTNADSYTVNEDHILSLVYSIHESRRGLNYGDIVNIRVKDYLELPNDLQKSLRGYKGSSSKRNFSTSTISIEPAGIHNFYGFNIDGDHLFQLGDGTVTHNCRSFLSPWNPINNPELPTDPNKFYGRLNCGVVSLNLPYIAAEAKNSVHMKMDETENSLSYLNRIASAFYETLDKYASLVHKAHQTRLKRILNTSVDCAPLLWRDGVFARSTDPNAKIGDIVKNGYASVSLGYAGLYECLTILGYKNHWEGSGKTTAFAIMQKLNDYCASWSLEDNMRYGVYGTPMESGTYKFAKALQSIYPSYDRLYITNSYHIPVFEDIDPFKKLEIEGEFQKLSKNGCISYVECADLSKNLEFVMQLQEQIYNSCMYAELNIKSCKCYTCGSEKPQEIDDDLTWYCTECGERRKDKLRHLYRICGYASTEDSNDGRASDVKNRFIHCDNHEI